MWPGGEREQQSGQDSMLVTGAREHPVTLGYSAHVHGGKNS